MLDEMIFPDRNEKGKQCDKLTEVIEKVGNFLDVTCNDFCKVSIVPILPLRNNTSVSRCHNWVFSCVKLLLKTVFEDKSELSNGKQMVSAVGLLKDAVAVHLRVCANMDGQLTFEPTHCALWFRVRNGFSLVSCCFVREFYTINLSYLDLLRLELPLAY